MRTEPSAEVLAAIAAGILLIGSVMVAFAFKFVIDHYVPYHIATKIDFWLLVFFGFLTVTIALTIAWFIWSWLRPDPPPFPQFINDSTKD